MFILRIDIYVCNIFDVVQGIREYDPQKCDNIRRWRSCLPNSWKVILFLLRILTFECELLLITQIYLYIHAGGLQRVGDLSSYSECGRIVLLHLPKIKIRAVPLESIIAMWTARLLHTALPSFEIYIINRSTNVL